eukprot:gene32102-16615_t
MPASTTTAAGDNSAMVDRSVGSESETNGETDGETEGDTAVSRPGAVKMLTSKQFLDGCLKVMERVHKQSDKLNKAAPPGCHFSVMSYSIIDYTTKQKGKTVVHSERLLRSGPSYMKDALKEDKVVLSADFVDRLKFHHRHRRKHAEPVLKTKTGVMHHDRTLVRLMIRQVCNSPWGTTVPIFQVYKYRKKNAAACPTPEFWSKHIPGSCGFEADVLEKSDPSTGQRYMCSIWDSLAEANLAVQMAEMPPPSGLANSSGARNVPTSHVLSADASGLGSVHAPPVGPATSIFASGVGGADATGLATSCTVAATSATGVMPPPRCERPKRRRPASGVEGFQGCDQADATPQAGLIVLAIRCARATIYWQPMVLVVAVDEFAGSTRFRHQNHPRY